jgi:hypothetical protein
MISKNLSSKTKKSKNLLNINKTKKNNKSELNLSNIKDVYNDIIKNCSDNNVKIIIEFLLNYYLLLKGLRNIFQIEYDTKEEYNILKKLILNKFILNLYKGKEKRLIFYNPNKFNINELDKTFGKKYAHQLGNFYVCATEFRTENIKYAGRVTIHARTNEPLLCKNGNKVYIWFSFYAQMCKYSDITNKKNLNKILKIFKPLQKAFKDFDDKLIIETNYIYY